MHASDETEIDYPNTSNHLIIPSDSIPKKRGLQQKS